MSDSSALGRRLEQFISLTTGEPARISGLVRLPGGASRETWEFSLGDAGNARRMVLRRDPPGGRRQHSLMTRATEFELLRSAAAAGVPVPRVLWLASDDGALGAPGFVMEHVAGETIPRRILRDDAYSAARDGMAAQCGEILTRFFARQRALGKK